MLGKTANGLYWLFRTIERSENTARLLEAGLRIALTRSASSSDEWASVLATAGVKEAYLQHHKVFSASTIVNFLLRDSQNPSSILSMIGNARNDARTVRTALTREVWEAVNECWLALTASLAAPVREQDVPALLELIRQHSARIRGALHGTMLRNDIFNFARLGTFVERADSTARILDVKYYVLLPSLSHVGSFLDNVQWESILRSVSGHRAYRWIYKEDYQPSTIADFLILNLRMPRSLAFCYSEIVNNLKHLEKDYDARHACHTHAEAVYDRLQNHTIEDIFEEGLHEFLQNFIADNNSLGLLIEEAYRFNG